MTQDDHSEIDFENARELVARRQVRRRAPKKVSNLVGKLMAHRGFAQRETSTELGHRWMEIVGQPLGARTRVGNMKRGVLEVEVDSPMTLQHLTFQKANLLRQLQNVLPAAKLRDLRFRVGNIG